MKQNILKKKALPNGSVALYACDCSGCGCSGCSGCACYPGSTYAYMGERTASYSNNTSSSKTSPISFN